MSHMKVSTRVWQRGGGEHKSLPGRRWDETGENYLQRSFMICTAYHYSDDINRDDVGGQKERVRGR